MFLYNSLYWLQISAIILCMSIFGRIARAQQSKSNWSNSNNPLYYWLLAVVVIFVIDMKTVRECPGDLSNQQKKSAEHLKFIMQIE